MKVSEISCEPFKEIGTRIFVKRDDKNVCKFFEKQGNFPACNAPGQFDCRMIQVRSRDQHSYSSFSSWYSCRRKYYLSYHRGIYPVTRADWQIRGRAFHKCLADHYTKAEKPTILYNDTPTMIGTTMAWCYVQHYNDGGKELEIETPLNDGNITGIVDRILRKESSIWDHKLSSDVPEFLSIAIQGAFYRRLCDVNDIPFERFVVNWTKAPDLKRKAGTQEKVTQLKKGKRKVTPAKPPENLEAFSERIIKDVEENPLRYFDRVSYARKEFDPFVKQIDITIKEIESVQKDIDHLYMQPTGCGWDCEYKPICITGQVDDKLFKVYKERKGMDHGKGRDI